MLCASCGDGWKPIQRHGTRAFIRVLRLLERFTLPELTEAVEYALDIDVIDADSVRMILEHAAERAGGAVLARRPAAPDAGRGSRRRTSRPTRRC